MNATTAPVDAACAHRANPPSDRSLVDAVRRGDQDAFEQLYHRHAGWLYPVLWRLAGGDAQRAEDWLQEAFVLAWRRLDQLNDGQAFGAWLKQLAVRNGLDAMRRKRLLTVPDRSATEAVEPPWPSDDLDLERAIATLPPRARQVLVLFQFGGLSHAEIGALLGIDAGTSKAQLHRARQLLKEVLQ